jgi:C-terminal processing protease CtpA/Prc
VASRRPLSLSVGVSGHLSHDDDDVLRLISYDHVDRARHPVGLPSLDSKSAPRQSDPKLARGIGPNAHFGRRGGAGCHRHDRSAFVKVEQLDGNVGYVKFNGFFDVEFCGPTASAAMNFVAGSRALIVDLRDNGGGSPAMVAYVSSYLFSTRTHLNDLWTRRTGATEEFWTRDVPGRRFGGEKPVYVLTSARTFSGAEEFTYNLKSLKRATIVGETTGGGAHPVSAHPIDEHFVIGVPFARAVNPITHTNWEGVGVAPDVKVLAADALATALKLARDGVRQ